MLQRLQLEKKLEVHHGCVNTVAWNRLIKLIDCNDDGGNDQQCASEFHQYCCFYCSFVFPKEWNSSPQWIGRSQAGHHGSIQFQVVIQNCLNFHVQKTETLFFCRIKEEVCTSHRANIFSAQFLPETSDHQIISCAGDGAILHTDILRQENTLNSFFNCHGGTVYEVAIVPGDPNSFLTCGEDGTVRWFDLRTKSKCAQENCKEDVLIRCQRAVTSLSLHPVVNYQLALGCSDSFVRVYDRRMLRSGAEGEVNGTTGLLTKFSPPGIGEAPRRITCVAYRPDGEELLASYSSDYIYVFDPRDCTVESGTKLKLGRPGDKCDSPQPVKKLRLRGDWSDTGPNSRPEMLSDRVPPSERESGEDRGLHSTLMQRMTDALSRMLNDPGTRMAMQRLHRGEGGEGEEEEDEEREGNRPVETVGNGEGEQGRAASAIQERWRNYRRRRREEEARRQEGESERPIPVEEEVDVEGEDEAREAMRSEVVVEEASEEVDRCSPLSICCHRFTRNLIVIQK